MFHVLRSHARQFALYILSGGTATAVDLGFYFLFIELNVYYLAAAVMSGTLAFITAFLLQKYVVFAHRKEFLRHLVRYFLVDMTNLAVITGLLFLLVDVVGMDPRLGKIVSLAPLVLWNFFIYKFFVYV